MTILQILEQKNMLRSWPEDLPQQTARMIPLPSFADSALVYKLAGIFRAHRGPVVCFVDDPLKVEKIRHQLFAYFHLRLDDFPSWGTLPFERSEISADTIQKRLQVCYDLQFKSPKVLAALPAVMQRVVPLDFLLTHVLNLKVGDHIDPLQFRDCLDRAGYRKVSSVPGPQQYSNAGGQIDFCPNGFLHPIRIEWFDDKIVQLTHLYRNCSGSAESVDEIRRFPDRAFPTDQTARKAFQQAWQRHFSTHHSKKSSVIGMIQKNQWPAGLEYWRALFFDPTPLPFLLDLLPKESLVLVIGDWEREYQRHWGWLESFYERQLKTIPVLPITSVWAPWDRFQCALRKFKQVIFTENNDSEWEKQKSTCMNLSVFQSAYLKPPLNWIGWLGWALEHHYTIWVTAVDSVQLSAMQDRLVQAGIEWVGPLDQFPTVGADLSGQPSVSLMLDREKLPGFVCKETRFAWLTSDIFEKQHLEEEKILTCRSELANDGVMPFQGQHPTLTEGTLVVHLKYGVGRYAGVVCLDKKHNQAGQEYLKLIYAQDAVLYVPVYEWHLLSRYTHLPGLQEQVVLNSLDGKTWQTQRKKVVDQAQDAAAQLLAQHARRTAAVGVSYKVGKEYEAFAHACSFEETPDQLLAIAAVIKDLQAAKPMDRLICGDVGFGKTEIALRAAFIVAKNHKQVVVLAPTTLLVEQHYNRFRERLGPWQIKVQMLSRFTSLSAKQEIFLGLKSGEIDVLIITHQLFHFKNIFKNLGLFIIDEEQRFGVRQKELIGQIDPGIDRLALSATPIPRTLSMVLSDLRSVSLVASPPKSRKAVKTWVGVYDAQVCIEAIQDELNRSGQIYYVYNRVASIDTAAQRLRRLIPKLRLGIAHGQMSPAALEETMLRFYRHEYDLLLSSTIIETGLDVGNANTLIVEKAEWLGLSQLHQLRGRVGRSNRQAYAYLFCDTQQSLKSAAGQRLQVLSEYQSLGCGFALAAQDLELRGCGEILGRQQSGKNPVTGVPLYLKLVEQAVGSLKKGDDPYEVISMNWNAILDLGVVAVFPESYVNELEARLKLYEGLSAIDNLEALGTFQSKMVQTYGALPQVAQWLFELVALRILMKSLRIQLFQFGNRQGTIRFQMHSQALVDTILTLVQQGWPNMPTVGFFMKPDGALCFKTQCEDAGSRVNLAKKFLQYLLSIQK